MRPGSEEELAEMLRGAAGPITVRGGGTRGPGGVAGPVLETAGLTGVVLYEPEALVMVARAGTPLAEVEAQLAAERQRLAFEPPDLRAVLGRAGVSTLGGVAAENASGPRRVQAGACRDALVGLRWVDGRGEIARNGGRVMKNVTGYDLVKLMAGSRGRLGVLTELAFKLQPLPPAVATLVLAEEGAVQAVAAMSLALGSPFDVTGAALLPGTGVLIRLEGLEASVAYRAAALAARLGAVAGAARVLRAPDECAALWAQVRDVTPLVGQPGVLWRVSVRPSDGPEVLARAGVPGVLDWGGGLVWLCLPEGVDLRARLAGLAGHATLMRGSGAPVLPPEAPGPARLSAALMRQFDPRGLFRAPA